MLSVMPEGTQTLMDPVELDSLATELAGTGAVLIQVPFDQPDNCSVDDDGWLPSILVIEYIRYHRINRVPVCGRCCAVQKIREILDVPFTDRPAHIHVHVLSSPSTGEAAHLQEKLTMVDLRITGTHTAAVIAGQIQTALHAGQGNGLLPIGMTYQVLIHPWENYCTIHTYLAGMPDTWLYARPDVITEAAEMVRENVEAICKMYMGSQSSGSKFWGYVFLVDEANRARSRARS